jgi:hypothetical protein
MLLIEYLVHNQCWDDPASAAVPPRSRTPRCAAKSLSVMSPSALVFKLPARRRPHASRVTWWCIQQLCTHRCAVRLTVFSDGLIMVASQGAVRLTSFVSLKTAMVFKAKPRGWDRESSARQDPAIKSEPSLCGGSMSTTTSEPHQDTWLLHPNATHYCSVAASDAHRMTRFCIQKSPFRVTLETLPMLPRSMSSPVS